MDARSPPLSLSTGGRTGLALRLTVGAGDCPGAVPLAAPSAVVQATLKSVAQQGGEGDHTAASFSLHKAVEADAPAAVVCSEGWVQVGLGH